MRVLLLRKAQRRADEQLAAASVMQCVPGYTAPSAIAVNMKMMPMEITSQNTAAPIRI